MRIIEILEANPNQQLALYNPHGKTYRGEPLPQIDPDDILQRGTSTDHVRHRDLAQHQELDTPETDLNRRQIAQLIQTNLHRLNDRQQQVIHLRFWEGLTLEQTARRMGVSTERVRQIEAKTLRLLRQSSSRLAQFDPTS
jgi:RNA polymerase sigma factor (sigma-70 family)